MARRLHLGFPPPQGGGTLAQALAVARRRTTLTPVGNDASVWEDGVAAITGVRADRTDTRWARRIVVDATVEHPVTAVFPYLADPLRWHDFAPAVAFRRQIDPGPPRIGTRWMSTDRIGPFRIHFIDTLEELEEHRRVVWGSSAPWNARVEYLCAEAGTRTRVRATYEGDLGDSLRWQVGWLPSWGWRGILSQDFRRLDRLLTLQAREAGRWELRHPRPAASIESHGAPGRRA